MYKCILRILSLICLFIGSIWLINTIFIPKRFYGIVPMKSFYAQEKETVDVLFLGSSHCGVTIDTGVLWKDYGISGFVLWGSGQPAWNSYYNLREALKTQSPKAVVFEVYAMQYDFEYQDEAKQSMNTGAMKFSFNKWEAIKVSAPKERWSDLMLGYPLYHTRYNELTKEDFLFFQNSRDLAESKGTGGCRWGTGEFELPDVIGITECKPIFEKQELYLRKMIELCQEENIPILLYVVPYCTRDSDQPYFNSVGKIAQEYDVEFLDFNLMEDAINFTAGDVWTDGGHVNTTGARKITRALGEYLKGHYELEDHRGQEQYASWDDNADMLEKEYLSVIQSKEDYFAEVSGTEYMCLYAQKGHYGLTEAERSNENMIIVQEADGVLNIIPADWKAEDNTVDLGEKFTVDLSSGITIRWEETVLLEEAGNGAAAVIYDPEKREIVDIVVMMENTNFAFEHRNNLLNAL